MPEKPVMLMAMKYLASRINSSLSRRGRRAAEAGRPLLIIVLSLDLASAGCADYCRKGKPGDVLKIQSVAADHESGLLAIIAGPRVENNSPVPRLDYPFDQALRYSLPQDTSEVGYVMRTGCLISGTAGWVFVEHQTSLRLEVVGRNLGAYEGTRVRITYRANVAKHAERIRIDAVRRLDEKCTQDTLPASDLQIVVVSGEGFTNNMKKRVAQEPIVEIRDRNDRPVPGAAVSFLLPTSGPGGTFANGQGMLTVFTGPNGRAIATGFTPNNVAGRFNINVTAMMQGQTATAAISQMNAPAVAAGIGRAAIVGIVVAVVAVAASVAVLVARD
jgi:hypothetical protein